MIIVHHLANSRSQRIIWLLEELGVPYEIVRYERDPKTRLAPPELKHIHPLGKSPVIVDDGMTVAETGLIMEYLCDRYDNGVLSPPKLSARDGPEWLRLRYWLHYAEGSVMPLFVLRLALSSLPEEAVMGMRAGFVEPQIKLNMDFWETQLAASGWFAGPTFSAADVIMSFPIETTAVRQGLGDDRPNLVSFLQRIKARPAYQRAIERGGAYAYA